MNIRGSGHRVHSWSLASSPGFASDTLTVRQIPVEGIPCYGVDAVDACSRPCRLSIDRVEGLLLRVWTSVSDDGCCEEIHRKIRINHAMDDKLFQGPGESGLEAGS